jgi:hypothetical protein
MKPSLFQFSLKLDSFSLLYEFTVGAYKMKKSWRWVNKPAIILSLFNSANFIFLLSSQNLMSNLK